MTIVQYAEYRGVTKQYISKLKGRGILDGALVKQKGKKRVLIDAKKADEILKKNQDPGFTKNSPVSIKAKSSGQKKQSGDKTFVEARTRSEQLKALNAELTYKIKAGELVKKSEVRDQAFKAARLFRDAILNIGPRLASSLAAETNESKILEILKREHQTALNELERSLGSIGNK
jgi:hypothetical protein